jgi:hypothetical protein
MLRQGEKRRAHQSQRGGGRDQRKQQNQIVAAGQSPCNADQHVAHREFQKDGDDVAFRREKNGTFGSRTCSAASAIRIGISSGCRFVLTYARAENSSSQTKS